MKSARAADIVNNQMKIQLIIKIPRLMVATLVTKKVE
jgi:hypothetical protein